MIVEDKANWSKQKQTEANGGEQLKFGESEEDEWNEDGQEIDDEKSEEKTEALSEESYDKINDNESDDNEIGKEGPSVRKIDPV